MHIPTSSLRGLAFLGIAFFLLCPRPGIAERVSDASSHQASDLSREIVKSWSGWSEILKNKWFGIPTWQNPLDVWITQEILQEVKPDVVIETGTKFGGSAVLWSMLLEYIQPSARVITIDVVNKAQKARRHPLAQKRVKFILASSIAPETIETIAQIAKGKKVLVILDSLHTREHVFEELKLYSPFVQVGSYIIVQDTLAGAGAAVKDFLAINDDFVIDTSRHRYQLTNNMNGFLKRIR
jgi:cephalosporin hydroxylase